MNLYNIFLAARITRGNVESCAEFLWLVISDNLGDNIIHYKQIYITYVSQKIRSNPITLLILIFRVWKCNYLCIPCTCVLENNNFYKKLEIKNKGGVADLVGTFICIYQ